MPRANPWQSYRQVALTTASPGQLVLMLYDGAIRFSRQALEGFAHEDPLEFNRTIHNNLTRAQAIINELNLSLNMEGGGELSNSLRRVYNYLDYRLQESNLRKEQEGIEEVVRRLSDLREAWAQMLQGGPATQTTGATRLAGEVAYR